MLPELRKFNWGAFFLTWIWGIFNKTFITLIILLIQFIPIVKFFGIFFTIWFGVKGNEWALKNKEWKSVEHFQKVQKKWAAWGLVIFFIAMFGLLLSIISKYSLSNAQQNMYKASFKMAANTLEQLVNTDSFKNNEINMTSGDQLAELIAKNMPENIGAITEGNKTKVFGGKILYICDCPINTKCTITVDANAEKAPNELTKISSKLKDRIEFVLIKNSDNTYEIIKPE